MSKFATRGAAALAVSIVLLAASAGTASANRGISAAPARAVSMEARALSFETEEGTLICDITFSGTLERATNIAKVARTTMGFITAARAEGCTGPFGERGTTITWLGMPWPIRYQAYLGVLPNITGMLIIMDGIGMLLRIRPLFFPVRECLYIGSVPMLGAVVGGVFSQARPLPNITIPLWQQLDAAVECPFNSRVSGTFSINPAQRLTLI